MLRSVPGNLTRDAVKPCFLFGQMKKSLRAILSPINAHLDVEHLASRWKLASLATLCCHHPPVISFHHCPRVHNAVSLHRDAVKWCYMTFLKSFYWGSLPCSLLVLLYGHHREIRHDESRGSMTRGLNFLFFLSFFYQEKLSSCGVMLRAYWKWAINDVVLSQCWPTQAALLQPDAHFHAAQKVQHRNSNLHHFCLSSNRMCSQND